MNRQAFINKAVRWGTVIVLTGLALLLRRKMVYGRDCSSCPDYASCSGLENCKTEIAKR